jgi:rhodanese-related sulfurtransferase
MLKKSLSLVTDLVRERFNRPLELRRVLTENAAKLQAPSPDTVAGSVAAASVPQWHEWAQASRSNGVTFQPGEIMGWKTHRDFGYSSYRVVLAELLNFGSGVRIPDWRCDIRQVQGLGASKTALARYACLDELAQHEAPSLVDEISSARLASLLSRREMRALRRQQSSDHFVRYLWDGRIFLINSSGSRHFAAARYIAGHIGQRVVLGSDLHLFSIEPVAVSSLRREFEMFAVSARDTVASIGFHDAIRQLRAPYLSKHMPAPFAHTEVVFLPRSDRCSMAVAAELRAAGFADVGKHLSLLVLRQHMNAVRYGEDPQVKAA